MNGAERCTSYFRELYCLMKTYALLALQEPAILHEKTRLIPQQLEDKMLN